MPVRVGIEMNSRAEGDVLRRSMEDPTIRAVALVSGILLDLPTIAQRRAVLTLVLATVAGDGEVPPHRHVAEVASRTPIDELPAMRLGMGRTTGE